MEPTSINNSNEENNNITEETIVNRQVRRMRFRELLDKVEEINASGDTSVETAKEVGTVFQEVSDLYSKYDIEERVKNPGEMVLEAKVLSTASEIVVKSLKAIDIGLTTYEPKEFTKKLMTFINQHNGNLGLLNLTNDANELIPNKLKYSYLYGAYDLNNAPQPPPRKTREKTIRENFTKTQPENVTKSVNDEKGIEEIVKFLYDVLCDEYSKQNRNYIKYYDYIIDTDDYSKTIENMFYFAFLIRDGRAMITLENNEPYIKPFKGRKDESIKNSQIIASITMKDWEQFRKPGYLQVKRSTTSSSSGKQ